MIIIFLLFFLLLIFGPQLWVKHVIKKHHKVIENLPGTGGELAKHFISKLGLTGINVKISSTGDFYNPIDKSVNLTEAVYHGKSLSAVAIATHEIGHAIQDVENDRRMVLRTKLVQLTQGLNQLASISLFLLPILGMLFKSPVIGIILGAIIIASMLSNVIFQLINLPVEWDASFGKAMPLLIEGQYIQKHEISPVSSILRAAALTYVAGALASILNFWRLFRLIKR